jgi:hypothetical protein
MQSIKYIDCAVWSSRGDAGLESVGKIIRVEVEANIFVGIALIDCANNIVKQRTKQVKVMKENGSEKCMIEQWCKKMGGMSGLDRWIIDGMLK